MLETMLLFVALAIIAGTGSKLIHKYVLRETEPYAFALLTNIVSAVIFLILAFGNFSLPKEPMAWIVLGIASILWTIIAVSVLISYKATDVSIREPLSQSKTIIALVLGILFFGRGDKNKSNNRHDSHIFGYNAIDIPPGEKVWQAV